MAGVISQEEQVVIVVVQAVAPVQAVEAETLVALAVEASGVVVPLVVGENFCQRIINLKIFFGPPLRAKCSASAG